MLSLNVAAHEMTPTFPKWQGSFIPSAKMTSIKVFNKRADVQWYQIGVFTSEFEPLPFVTRFKILKVDYLKTVQADIYINEDTAKLAEYICSTSKLRGDDSFKPIVESRICSKFK